MTFSTDVAKRDHRVAYYLKFDGVAAVLATVSGWAGAPATVHAVLQIPRAGAGPNLDRTRGLVLPGAFSAEVHATDATHTFFARRGGAEFRIEDTISPTVTLIPTDRTDLAGATVYLDRETITLGTHTGGGTYSGCVRGVEDSQPRAHSNGAIGSDRPRHWLGRRAQLFGINLDTGTTKALRTARVSGSPRFAGGVYQLEFTDLQTELQRPIVRGWKTVPAVWLSYDDGSQSATFAVDAREFSTEADSYVRFDVSGGLWVVFLDRADVNRGANTITVSTHPDATKGVASINSLGDIVYGVLDNPPEMTARTCWFSVEDPALMALRLLTSSYGDGANGAHDVLPGVAPDAVSGATDTIEKRIGAGLPESFVDVQSWLDVVGVREPQQYFLDEEMPLLDFLTNEIAMWLGGRIELSGAGQIAFHRYEPAIPDSSLVTIDTSDAIIRGVKFAVDDELDIISSANIEVNWCPITRTYRHSVGITWVPTSAIYGEGRAQIEFKSRSLLVSGQAQLPALTGGTAVREEQLVTAMDRIYSRTRNGSRRVQFAVPWKFVETIVVGTAVRFTDPDVPDLEGGRSLAGRQHEIIRTEEDYESGLIRCEAEEMPTGRIIAPAAYVASYSGGFITFETAAAHESDLFDSDPAFDYPHDATIRIYQAGALPPFSVSETKTIQEITVGGTIDTGSDTAWGIQDGDLVVLEYSADVGLPSVAPTTDANVSDHLFMSDDASPPRIDDGGANERDAMDWS